MGHGRQRDPPQLPGQVAHQVRPAEHRRQGADQRHPHLRHGQQPRGIAGQFGGDPRPPIAGAGLLFQAASTGRDDGNFRRCEETIGQDQLPG